MLCIDNSPTARYTVCSFNLLYNKFFKLEARFSVDFSKNRVVLRKWFPVLSPSITRLKKREGSSKPTKSRKQNQHCVFLDFLVFCPAFKKGGLGCTG